MSVREILHTFHAAGHLPYAKSAQLYLQEMERLEELLPTDDFEKYINQGYFTIRQTNRAGVWIDMTIEQVLMKMMKVQGCMTRGRGITDTALVYFICALPPCIPIMEALLNISGTLSASSEQHVAYKYPTQGTTTSMPEQGCHRSRQVHHLAEDTHSLRPKHQTKLISVFSGMSADDTLTVIEQMKLAVNFKRQC